MNRLFLYFFTACFVFPVAAQDKDTNGTTGASNKSAGATTYTKKTSGLIMDRASIQDTLPIVILDEMPIPYEQYKNFSAKQKKKFGSIETLKGVEATAIYGSRGAGGVIVITSKDFKSSGKKVILPDAKGVYLMAEVMPVFPGGNAALTDYLKMYMKEHAVSAAEKGTVLVRFVINSGGFVEEPQAIKKLSEAQNELAIGACKNMPAWKPATIRGKNVPIYMTLPFRFL